MQFVDIQQFTHGAIWFGIIPYKLTFKSDDVFNFFSKFFYGEIGSSANVNMSVADFFRSLFPQFFFPILNKILKINMFH